MNYIVPGIQLMTVSAFAVVMETVRGLLLGTAIGDKARNVS